MSIHSIQYEGIEIEFELVRKDVKYINLRVNKNGEVVVSAAEKVPFSVIEDFVHSKTLWIITHLAEIEKIRQQIPPAGFYDGKTLYYLGKAYRLVLAKGEPDISIVKDEIRMHSPRTTENALHEEYLIWLKTQATPLFGKIMNQLYPLVESLGVKKPTIQIRNMKSLWGSCTAQSDSIRLNLQLMKAPEDCIEQVILHELIHFVHPNHGADFYALLTRLMPDWKERKNRLESKYKDGV